MNYKMSDLKGIDQNLVAKLHEAGVETTSDLMQVWHDPDRRTQIATGAGLNDDQLSRMVSMARMARMKGVGPKYADLLVTAGVIGRKSLAKHTPEALVRHLGEVSTSRNLAGPLPTLVEVGAWFADLKPLNAPAE
jgi:hypothetical protein